MSGSWHQVWIFESLDLWQSSCHKVWYLCRIILPLNLTIGEAPLKQNAGRPFQVQWSPADLIPEPHDISGGTVCSDFPCRAEAVVQLWGLYRWQVFDSPLPHSTRNFNKRNTTLFFWSWKSLPSFTFEDVPPNFKDTLIFLSITLNFRKCCVPVNSSQSQRPCTSSKQW